MKSGQGIPTKHGTTTDLDIGITETIIGNIMKVGTLNLCT